MAAERREPQVAVVGAAVQVAANPQLDVVHVGVVERVGIGRREDSEVVALVGGDQLARITAQHQVILA